MTENETSVQKSQSVWLVAKEHTHLSCHRSIAPCLSRELSYHFRAAVVRPFVNGLTACLAWSLLHGHTTTGPLVAGPTFFRSSLVQLAFYDLVPCREAQV